MADFDKRLDNEFQSTPPVKAATDACRLGGGGAWISIHAAREGGDHLHIPAAAVKEISIHAAREGGDQLPVSVGMGIAYFNPRRP